MKVSREAAVEAYGRNFVVLEARDRTLTAYKYFNIAGVADAAAAQPYHAKRLQNPEVYKTNPPDSLVIRETLGDYWALDEAQVGERHFKGFAGLVNDIMRDSELPRYMFRDEQEAVDIAREMMQVSGRTLPVRHEHLPDTINLPVLAQIGMPMHAFVRNITDRALQIDEYAVDEAYFTTSVHANILTVMAEPKTKGLPSLMEVFRSADRGKTWRRSFKDAEVTGYFTHSAALRGARAYATRIHKNIGSFLPT